MNDSLSLQLSRSMVVIFRLEDGGSEDVGDGYVIMIITIFTLPLALTFISACLYF
jgi:hypothetical protein